MAPNIEYLSSSNQKTAMMLRGLDMSLKSFHSPNRRFVVQTQRYTRTSKIVVGSVSRKQSDIRTGRSAKDVITRYYECYNEKNIDEVLKLFSEDVVYEDLIYQEPFQGKQSVAAYFTKIGNLVPKDIKFVVDDITESDERKCGVLWHVELESEKDGLVDLPFSRGCSFYVLNEQGEISFARDIVEPAIKPGESALKGINTVAPLIRKLGNRANPAFVVSADGKNLVHAGLMFGFSISYILVVLFSTIPPGSPIYQTNPDDLERILHESYNFFYVNMVLGSMGLNVVPNIAENPVDEGLFNLINAWSLMFLPLWVADPKGKSVDWTTKGRLWFGTMFLTNVFLPFYMTLRLIPDIYRVESAGDNYSDSNDGGPEGLQPGKTGSKIIASTSLLVGIVSLGWIAVGRPEYSLTERLDFLTTEFTTDRVFWAFCLDACLYSVWQYWILSDLKAPMWQRLVPFYGLAAWILKPQGQEKSYLSE